MSLLKLYARDRIGLFFGVVFGSTIPRNCQA